MNNTDQNDRTGFYPWAVWGLAALFYCYGFFQRVAPSVMVDELMADFAVSAAILGNLSAFYFYAYASLQLPIGVMVDHWGARRMLVGAALMCGLGSLMFAKADGLMMAYAGRLLIGAGAGFSWVGALKLASQWLPPKRFAMVSGMTLMLGMMGAVAGQAPLSAAVSAFGWRGTLNVAAFVAFAIAVLIWLIVRDKAPDLIAQQKQNDVSAQTAGLLSGLKLTLKNPQSWYAAVFGGAMTAPMLSFAGLWGVPYLMEVYGLERPAAAASTSMMLIGWAIGAPLAGWASDFIRSRRLPMLIGAFMALFIFAIILFVPGLSLTMIRGLLLLQGFFSGSMVICFAIGREHNKSNSAGATLAFVNTVVMASGALFQPLIGWLLDLNWDGAIRAGSRVYSADAYQTAFISLIVCGVTATLMGLLLRETHCRNVSADAD
ncbi:MAG: MFS transporter [Rhodospirillales bacterium]|nr:MFS transporter [Rhodospirillales bacterium]